MLITEHKFNPEPSHTPNLIFVDASFSPLYPSQNFSLQIRMQESFSPYPTIETGAAKAANRSRKLAEQKE